MPRAHSRRTRRKHNEHKAEAAAAAAAPGAVACPTLGGTHPTSAHLLRWGHVLMSCTPCHGNMHAGCGICRHVCLVYGIQLARLFQKRHGESFRAEGNARCIREKHIMQTDFGLAAGGGGEVEGSCLRLCYH